MVSIPSEKELLAAACHFGHPKQKWNPKMAPFIYGVKSGIHIFDLGQTRNALERACEALMALRSQGKTIMLVSTKQQSLPIVERFGRALNLPTVTKKWIPGLLTNWATLKKRLQYYRDLRQAFITGEVEKYTKKEQVELRKKLTKLDVALGGVADLHELPDALIVVDAVRDNVAVKEARKCGIPVFGMCDSNADPDDFTVFIPSNDDATRSIDIILGTLEKALVSASAGERPAAAKTAVAA